MIENVFFFVVVIGVGLVGFVVVVCFVECGLELLIFEKGMLVGFVFFEWGYVWVFSFWKYNIDDVVW